MDDKAETEESALVYNQGKCPILKLTRYLEENFGENIIEL